MTGRVRGGGRASVGVGVAALALLALASCEGCDDAPAPTVRRYADIPKIDVHVHVPPARAEEAVRVFARHGVRVALNASGGRPGPALDANAAAAERTEGRLRPYCNLDFSGVERPSFADDARAALRRCRESGAVGLKIFKALGLGYTLSDGSLLAVDDPRLDPVFDEAGALGLPVLIHSGDPQAFFRPADAENERLDELRAHPSWSFYGARPDGRGRWPSWEDVFEQYARRVARHPDTRFLGAHFGNAPEEPERVGRMLAAHPNLFVETGARVPELGRHPAARMRRLFVRFHDRILFGTDVQMGRTSWVLGSAGAEPDPPSRIPAFYEAHWRWLETSDRRFAHPTPIQGDWTIDGIELPREVLEDVYHRNAERLFGLDPVE